MTSGLIMRDNTELRLAGFAYGADGESLFVWASDGTTYKTSDGGETFVEQSGKTIEADDGVHIAGREPPFVSWWNTENPPCVNLDGWQYSIGHDVSSS